MGPCFERTTAGARNTEPTPTPHNTHTSTIHFNTTKHDTTEQNRTHHIRGQTQGCPNTSGHRMFDVMLRFGCSADVPHRGAVPQPSSAQSSNRSYSICSMQYSVCRMQNSDLSTQCAAHVSRSFFTFLSSKTVLGHFGRITICCSACTSAWLCLGLLLSIFDGGSTGIVGGILNVSGTI